MLTWPIDHSWKPASKYSAEGGFEVGDEVIIRLPGDDWDGQTHAVQEATYPRMCLVGPEGKSRHYCVAALEHAPV